MTAAVLAEAGPDADFDYWSPENVAPLIVYLCSEQAAGVSGPVAARIGGSGDVKIAGGHATQLSLDVAGSGDFTFAGTADAVSATV